MPPKSSEKHRRTFLSLLLGFFSLFSFLNSLPIFHFPLSFPFYGAVSRLLSLLPSSKNRHRLCPTLLFDLSSTTGRINIRLSARAQ